MPQPGEPADRALPARDRVDADGRRISRQHLRPAAMPVLAARVPRATATTRRRSASGTPAPTPAMAATGIFRSSGTGRRTRRTRAIYYEDQIIECNGVGEDGRAATRPTTTPSGPSTTSTASEPRQGQAVVSVALLRRDSRPFHARPAAPWASTRTSRSMCRPIFCRRGRGSRSTSTARRPGTKAANGEIIAGKTGAEFGDEGVARQDV